MRLARQKHEIHHHHCHHYYQQLYIVGNMPVDQASSYVQELDTSSLSVSQKQSSRFLQFVFCSEPHLINVSTFDSVCYKPLTIAY
jgi:hypothetical protein